MGRLLTRLAGQGIGGRAAGWRVWLPVAFAALLLAVGLCWHAPVYGCMRPALIAAGALRLQPHPALSEHPSHSGPEACCDRQDSPVHATRSHSRAARPICLLRAGRATRWCSLGTPISHACHSRSGPQHTLPHLRAEYSAWNGVGSPLR